MIDTIYIVVFVVGVIAASYIAYDQIVVKSKKQRLGKYVRVFLFEKVGKEKVYREIITAEEKDDPVLGVFLYLPVFKKELGNISQDDFMPDTKFGRCLMLCKYSDDDYRPISPVKEGVFLKKVDLKPHEYLETEDVEQEDGSVQKKLKLLDNGEPIPLVDENGEPYPDHTYVEFIEPMGITQQDREAQRAARAHALRMEAKRREKAKFWEKYGTFIMAGLFAIVLLLGFSYMANKNAEVSMKAMEQSGEKAADIISSPGFAQNVMDWMEKRNAPEAPPN